MKIKYKVRMIYINYKVVFFLFRTIATIHIQLGTEWLNTSKNTENHATAIVPVHCSTLGQVL